MPIRIKTIERPSGRGKVQSQDGQDLAVVSYRLRVTQREQEAGGFADTKPKWLAVQNPKTQGTLELISGNMGGLVDTAGRSFVLILDAHRKLPFVVGPATKNLGRRNFGKITYQITSTGPFETI